MSGLGYCMPKIENFSVHLPSYQVPSAVKQTFNNSSTNIKPHGRNMEFNIQNCKTSLATYMNLTLLNPMAGFRLF